jgi:type III secretion protein V
VHEFRRLVQTISDTLDDAEIKLPDDWQQTDVRLSMTLSENPLVLEVGKELAYLFDGDRTHPFVAEMLPMMYDGLFYELGVQFPDLHGRAASDVPPWSARIVINDIPAGEVEVRPDSFMVNDSAVAMVARGFAAEPAVNPANGNPCAWIPSHQAAAVGELGLTVWDAGGVLILALTSVLRHIAADFIGVDEVRAMLEQIEPVFPRLVAETVPKTVPLFLLTDVLRRLVAEEVSIRDLRRILMALAEWGRVDNDPVMLTEYVRAAMQRYITHKWGRGQNTLPVVLLDPKIEEMIQSATRHTATGSHVNLQPKCHAAILRAIRGLLAGAAAALLRAVALRTGATATGP